VRERTFGSLLEKKRRELSLSRQALADRLGVSQSHIAWLESGNRAPSLTMFQRLADALNLDAQQIFFLVRPAAARFLLESGNDQEPENSVWQGLAANKALCAKERISPAELRVLSEISRLGRVSSQRQLLLVLRSIRLACEDDQNLW
jgi:transcriptional regulator with XRE-family HTH domain